MFYFIFILKPSLNERHHYENILFHLFVQRIIQTLNYII